MVPAYPQRPVPRRGMQGRKPPVVHHQEVDRLHHLRLRHEPHTTVEMTYRYTANQLRNSMSPSTSLTFPLPLEIVASLTETLMIAGPVERGIVLPRDRDDMVHDIHRTDHLGRFALAVGRGGRLERPIAAERIPRLEPGDVAAPAVIVATRGGVPTSSLVVLEFLPAMRRADPAICLDGTAGRFAVAQEGVWHQPAIGAETRHVSTLFLFGKGAVAPKLSVTM